MAAEHVTPLDELTGLPLPIAPPDLTYLPGLVPKNHHHHFHPELSPLLLTPAGLAVRNCRVQYMRKDIHDNYHRIFAGPPLPGTDEEAFRMAVLAVAGVVPRQAIDISSPDEYKIITLGNDEYLRLARPAAMHVDRGREVGRFFAEYAAQQGIGGQVNDGVINEFLDTKTSRVRKLELARTVFLASALELSLQSVAEEHRILREEALVIQQKRESVYRVVRRFIRQRALQDFSEAIEHRLATS